jgi:hypothetical protein
MQASRMLYRGVSETMHAKLHGQLRPKQCGVKFVATPEYGRAEYNSGVEYGYTEGNAVIEHQQHQAGFPTSGISTTPHLARAQFYATHGGTHPSGYVYAIDVQTCLKLGVRLYNVKDCATQPTVPEDDEVVLVARDCGVLPQDVIVEVIKHGV